MIHLLKLFTKSQSSRVPKALAAAGTEGLGGYELVSHRAQWIPLRIGTQVVMSQHLLTDELLNSQQNDCPYQMYNSKCCLPSVIMASSELSLQMSSGNSFRHGDSFG